MPGIVGVPHIGLTVRDMDASAQWYQRVFGWQVVGWFGPGERATPRVRLYDHRSQFGMGLCQPEDGSDDRFNHCRTGLDHLAFEVASEEELERWIVHLDSLEIAHSPVRNVDDLAKFLSFEDPDGIQLEVWLRLRLPTGESHPQQHLIPPTGTTQGNHSGQGTKLV